MSKAIKITLLIGGLSVILLAGTATLVWGYAEYESRNSGEGNDSVTDLVCRLPDRIQDLFSTNCAPRAPEVETAARATPPPTAMPVSSPTATSTPPPATADPGEQTTRQAIEPFPDAPLCAYHDPAAYHGLWNEQEGCHYDHTHGYDPQDTPFADQVVDWDFNFPWQTFSTYGGDPWAVPDSESVFENEAKHKGFFYLYDEAANGCEKFNVEADSSINCVTKVLYQLHSVGTQQAMVTRFHSFRIIAEVCTPDGARCGTIETGGIHDYGTLHCRYKKEYCELPNDPPGPLPAEISTNLPPYRAFHSTADSLDFPPERDLRDGNIRQFWNSLINEVSYPYYPHQPNYLVGTAWGFFDATELLYKADPSKPFSICAELLSLPYDQCEFNHSSAALFTVRFRLHEDLLRLAEDGVINYSGYTDRYGHLVEGCTQAGLDCVPLILENYPAAEMALLNRSVHDEDPDPAVGEFDIYFDSEGQVCPTNLPHDSCTTSGWIVPP